MQHLTQVLAAAVAALGSSEESSSSSSTAALAAATAAGAPDLSGAFGSSFAYRCVGLLWSLAEFVGKARRKRTAAAAAAAAAAATPAEAATAAAAAASLPDAAATGFGFSQLSPHLRAFEPLWQQQQQQLDEEDEDEIDEVLSYQTFLHLSHLATDSRAELRHCSLRSLTSALRSHPLCMQPTKSLR